MYNDMQLEQKDYFLKPKSMRSNNGGNTHVDLATLLNRTFNSPNNEEVQAAEKALEMLTTYPDFIEKLAGLLSDQTQKAEIKEAAVNYLQRHTYKIVSGRNQVQINEVAGQLNRILGRDDILLKYRRKTVATLQLLLARDTKNIARAAYSDNLSRCLAQAVTHEPVLGYYQYCVLFGAAILAFPKYDYIYENMADKSFANFCQMGNLIMKELSLRAYQSLDWYTSLYYRLYVLDSLMTLLGLFFLRKGWNSNPTLLQAYCSSSMLQLLDNIFSCISLGNGYYITNFGKTHYSIYNKNEVLASAVDIAKRVYENLLYTSQSPQLVPVVHRYLQSFYKQIKNLLKFSRNITVREFLGNTPSGRCELATISSIITFMASMSNILALEYFYYTFSRKFIQEMVIPFLELSSADVGLFVHYPDMAIGMYIPLLSDYTIEKIEQSRQDGFIPEEMLVHLSINQLLNNIARNSHGWLPTVVNYIVQMLISYSLPIAKRYPWIMILAVLSREVCARDGDAELVKHYFLKEMTKKHTYYSDYQVAEITLLLIMISRYGKIFKKNPLFSRQVISWTMTLIDGVTTKHDGDRCLTLASVETVETILKVLDSGIVPKTLVSLTGHLLSKKDPPLKALEIIYEIFRYENVRRLIHGRYSTEFDESSDESEEYHDIPERMEYEHQETIQPVEYREVASHVIKNCVTRILKYYSSAETSHVIIEKCWHIIRQIMESSDREISTSNWVVECFNFIKPLYQFLSSEKDTDYNHELLKLHLNFLKRYKKLENPIKYFFYAVPRIFQQYGYITEPMFYFLIYFVRYCSSEIRQSPNVLAILISIAVEGILVRIDSKNAHEGHACLAVLLLQELVVQFANELSSNEWNASVYALFRRLTKHQFIKYTFLKSHIVCCLAICLLNNPHGMSIEIYDAVLSTMVTEVGCFDMYYPIKLYVVSSCEIIKKFPSEKNHKLFRSVFCTLAISYNRYRNRIQMKEDGEDLVEIPETEEEVYHNGVKILENVVKSIDYYEYFAQTADWLVKNNPALFKYFESQLVSTDREHLNLVVSVRKVKEAPRKIVKLKR